MSLAFLMALAPVRALAQVPAAPANMQADANAGTGHITITWDNPNDNTIIIYEYRVRIKHETEWRPDWTEFTGSDANTVRAVLTNIGQGTTIEFHLRARNANGHGPDSFVEATSSRTTPNPDPPVPDPPNTPVIPDIQSPVNLRADFEDSVLDSLVMSISWEDPDVDNIAGYQIRIYRGGPTNRMFPVLIDWTDVGLVHSHRISLSYEGIHEYTVDVRYFLESKIFSREARAGVIVPFDIISIVTSLDKNQIPDRFQLLQNYPNPFNSSTTIEYAITEAGPIRLTIYDMLGQEIIVLVDRIMPAGTYQIFFDAGDLPSGAYVYRLETAHEVTSNIMSFIK